MFDNFKDLKRISDVFFFLKYVEHYCTSKQKVKLVETCFPFLKKMKHIWNFLENETLLRFGTFYACFICPRMLNILNICFFIVFQKHSQDCEDVSKKQKKRTGVHVSKADISKIESF